MSLTDGPLWVKPTLALQALREAGVTLTAKIEEGEMQDRVTVQAVWRAEVRRRLGEAAHMQFPVMIEVVAPTLEEAAGKVLAAIRRQIEAGEAAARAVEGAPWEAVSV